MSKKGLIKIVSRSIPVAQERRVELLVFTSCPWHIKLVSVRTRNIPVVGGRFVTDEPLQERGGGRVVFEGGIKLNVRIKSEMIILYVDIFFCFGTQKAERNLLQRMSQVFDKPRAFSCCNPVSPNVHCSAWLRSVDRGCGFHWPEAGLNPKTRHSWQHVQKTTEAGRCRPSAMKIHIPSSHKLKCDKNNKSSSRTDNLQSVIV